MAELKTKPTDASVPEYLAAISDPTQRADAKRIDAIMRKVVGKPAKLWGTSIVGYGECHMVYETGRELDWPLVGFSPRKTNTTLYIMPGFADYEDSLSKLGKFKTGVSCLYIKKLADVDEVVLTKMIADSVATMRAKYQSAGTKQPAAKKPAAKKPAAKKPAAKKPAAKQPR